MGHKNGLSSYKFGCKLGYHMGTPLGGSRFGSTLGGFGTRFGSFRGTLIHIAIKWRRGLGTFSFSPGGNLLQNLLPPPECQPPILKLMGLQVVQATIPFLGQSQAHLLGHNDPLVPSGHDPREKLLFHVIVPCLFADIHGCMWGAVELKGLVAPTKRITNMQIPGCNVPFQDPLIHNSSNCGRIFPQSSNDLVLTPKSLAA